MNRESFPGTLGGIYVPVAAYVENTCTSTRGRARSHRTERLTPRRKDFSPTYSIIRVSLAIHSEREDT